MMLPRALFASLVAACLTVSCASSSGGDSEHSPSALLSSGSATPNAEILDGLTKFPASIYHSIEEASAAAGYAIPKPAPEYSLVNNETGLQGVPGTGVLTSVSKYKFPGAELYFEVDVGPASVWNGDATWTVGDRIAAGPHDGWLHTQGSTLFYAWRCGVAGGEPLWCVVFGGTKIGKKNFLAFVASLA